MIRGAFSPPDLDANALRPSPVDLFGQVPVLQREVRLWLWSVPVWFSRHASPARVASYLRGYDVHGKIRREKLAGTLQAMFGDETCPHCGALLEPEQPGRMAPWRPSAIHLAPVIHLDDEGHQGGMLQVAKDAVIPHPIPPVAGQLADQGLAGAAWIGAADDFCFEVAEDPPVHRRVELFQVAQGRGAEFNPPAQVPS